VCTKQSISVNLLEVFGLLLLGGSSRSCFYDLFFLADCGRCDPPKGGGSVDANGNSGKTSKSAGGNGWMDVS
jgi:hypothetical protein